MSFMDKQPINYLTLENGVSIAQFTSQTANCPCRNILLSEKRAIWLSDQGLPQSIVLNMSNQIKRPRFYKCFGFYCWHDYPSNPSVIELLASTDGQNFITWTVIHAELRAGVQLFQIDPLAIRYNFLKIVIKETFGASKTYLNQVFLFEENPLTEMQGSSAQSSVVNSNVNTVTKKNDTLNDEYRQNIQLTNFDQGTSNASRRHGWDNPTVDPRFSRGYNKNLSNFPPEHVETNQRGSFATGAPASKPNLVDGSISIMNPNLEHQAGNFFSPTQDNYFSNTNLSLINDTAQRRADPQSSHSKNSPSFYELGGTQANQTTSLNYSHKNSTKKQLYTIPSPNEKSNSQINHRFSSLKGPNEFMEQIENEDRKSTQRQSHHEERNNLIPENNENQDTQMPFLTRTEKEVIKMKQEIGGWGATITNLQENMTKLLEKVSSISNTIEKENTQQSQNRSERKQSPRTNDNENKVEEKLDENQGTRGSHVLNQSQTLGDYLEDFKKNITVYLDNILTQNQTIITENNKLRQNLDNFVSNQPSVRKGYQDTSYHSPGYVYPPLQQNEWNAREIEKIVNSLFERNFRSWENIFYTHVKSQNDLLEERVTQKLTNAIENLKEREELLKKKVFEEIAKLQSQKEPKTTVPKSSNFLSVEDRSNTNRQKFDIRPLNKEMIGGDFDTSFTQRGNVITEETQLDLGLDKRTQRLAEGKQADQRNATQSNIQKVQYLMERLQEKIALRDKKVQELQREDSISLSPHKDNFE